MTQEEERLRAENAALREELEQVKAKIAELEGRP
jgi:uncharacterized protein YhaN